jgi:hypothetical protein
MSPYLERPLMPLTVALPRLLEEIEAEIADKATGVDEKSRLRERVELMRQMLNGSRDPIAKYWGATGG